MAAIKGASNTVVSYNGSAITAYTNSAELQNTIAELEATHLGSLAEEADPGLSSASLQLGGDWAAALDAILGPDSLTGTKRTVVISFEDGATVVSWTWTSQGFITNYAPKSAATGKLEWSATLRLSGLGVRSVA